MFCFKQKTAYEMRISDWSSDVCSSDLFRAQSSDTQARCGQGSRDASRWLTRSTHLRNCRIELVLEGRDALDDGIEGRRVANQDVRNMSVDFGHPRSGGISLFDLPNHLPDSVLTPSVSSQPPCRWQTCRNSYRRLQAQCPPPRFTSPL